MLHYCGAFQTLFQTLRKCRVWPQNGLNVFLATMREANNNQMVCCLFFGLKGKVNWPGRSSCCGLTCVIIINRKLQFFIMLKVAHFQLYTKKCFAFTIYIFIYNCFHFLVMFLAISPVHASTSTVDWTCQSFELARVGEKHHGNMKHG